MSPMTTSPPRFLIAGAGALGSAFGAMLRLGGHEVALLGRNAAHLDAIAARGLRMRGLWGERTAAGFAVCTDVARTLEVEYVLVATKSCDTPAIVAEIAPHQPRAQFVTLQNGLGNLEAISSAVGPARTLGGMVIIGFAIPKPAEVAVTVYGGDVLVGRPGAPPGGEGDPHVAALAASFDAAGITTHATDNIRGTIWGKVIYNCALNALGAILGVPYGALASPHTWAVIEDVVRECFVVARAEAVTLPWRTGEEYLAVLAERQLPATAAHRASMLQDIERGRRTEIAHLNGAIARIAAERGLRAPVNAVLADIVRHMEARELARRGGEG
jgi:2-dehydropantoate 2-reductase